MTETAKEIAQRISPLVEEHRSNGATLSERDGCSLPASYGDTNAEYVAVRESAGLIDLSCRGLLSVSGTEAIQFLNGLITNDMKTLAEGHWMAAVFPNVQGRLIASIRVVRLKDRDGVPSFMIDTEGATHEVVLATLKRFTLAGDFRVTDLSTEMLGLSVQGKETRMVLNNAFGEAVPQLDQHQVLEMDWNGKPLTVIPATHTAEDGFDIFVASNDAVELWRSLVAAGAIPVGLDALEVLRIEAGIARHGIDMDETNVVSETNLDDAVSFTKGCYIGQEIIARIKYRGHVAKKLTGIKFPTRVSIESGTVLRSLDDKEIGRITSATFSPALNCTIALSYLKYDYLAPGTEVEAVSQDERYRATVTDLPFVRGSWARANDN
jgi:aminomethyltransferase